MADALKDAFGPDIPVRIADAISRVHPEFPAQAFVADALRGYDDLELTARGRQIAAALHTYLPADYEEAIEILLASLRPETEQLTGMAAFFYSPHVFFVAEFGLDHWDSSMRGQYELTKHFTAEYSIRAFLDREPERTLARLGEWARDPSPDVRRLVSEGTRPRLPWAPRLRRFQHDPSPVIELLELIRDDPSLYVRRSVANNMNDIGKDHPDVLIDTCRRWLVDAGEERRWVIRHALRSAVKRGDQAALSLLGFESGQMATVSDVSIVPGIARIGGSVRVSLTVTNAGQGDARYNVDLRIHFVKANGGTSAKVFKGGEVTLRAGQRASISKLISLRQQTTRTHYPGEHCAEAIVNGDVVALGSFDLTEAVGSANIRE